MTRLEVNANYRHALLQAQHDDCRQNTTRYFAHTDLFYFLTRVLHRVDADNDWVFKQARMWQAAPDGYLDLWWREGYKSTIITFAGIIQGLMNDPERTYGIISITRPSAKKFLRQIKVELETNEALKDLAPDVFWQNPKKEAPKWSEDDGLVIRRKGNPRRGETHGHEYLWLTVHSANSYAEILQEIANRPLETVEELIASGALRAGGKDESTT